MCNYLVPWWCAVQKSCQLIFVFAFKDSFCTFPYSLFNTSVSTDATSFSLTQETHILIIAPTYKCAVWYGFIERSHLHHCCWIQLERSFYKWQSIIFIFNKSIVYIIECQVFWFSAKIGDHFLELVPNCGLLSFRFSWYYFLFLLHFLCYSSNESVGHNLSHEQIKILMDTFSYPCA